MKKNIVLEITLSGEETYTQEQEKQFLENVVNGIRNQADSIGLVPDDAECHTVGIKASAGKLSSEIKYCIPRGWVYGD